MANKIIPQEDFDNIVSLFRSKQIENIQLGMCLVKGQQCYTQFRDHFGKSFGKFSSFFKKVILDVSETGNFDRMIDELILYIVDGEYLPSIRISDILIDFPELYKEFDLSRFSGLYISCVLRYQPHLYTEFDLSKCNKSDIDWICQFQPQLKPYFNQL
jgi:hypothetical protein